MNHKQYFPAILLLFISGLLWAQENSDPSLLTLDRIYASNEFAQDRLGPIKWIKGGQAFVRIERTENKDQVLVRYQASSLQKSVILKPDDLVPDGAKQPIEIEDFFFSHDENKILLFTNSSRVWRSNTKGDFWMYDLEDGSLGQIGQEFPPSSLMFAKFSKDMKEVAFVHGFNLYTQNIITGKIRQLTFDGGNQIINGTFDWVYEEEFGIRDGFRWNPDSRHIAFWNLDASDIGIFYMIDNTDSIYSRPIPIQYPKVGQDPSACRVGILSINGGETRWISLEGSSIQNYIPGMQWVNENILLIQQLNRKQNRLTVWSYDITKDELKKIYVETEETWLEIQSQDITVSHFGDNAFTLTDNNNAFLRLREVGDWRHLYKVDIHTGKKINLTPGNYDVASLVGLTVDFAYLLASPENSTQRYLYRVDLKGTGQVDLITPGHFRGFNTYNCSPDGRWAIHSYTSAMSPPQSTLISLPDHRAIGDLIENRTLRERLSTLSLPEVEFFKVTTADEVEIDIRMIKPVNFNPANTYPVLFHIYGEPVGQVAVDRWIGMWNIFLAQKGYLIVDMDPRGAPCLKGSRWRKSVYRKMGVLNTRDLAMAASEVLKLDYVDEKRTAVWGWSGGGTMTMNLMFQYPGTFTTGMSVAGISNLLLYDNIYMERYMGLPQQTLQDYIKGSPVTYVENLKGNLLVIHGTLDDNVHYQNLEVMVNELIRHNKKFTMMSYPNRSHGIYEGKNTRRHLYTLLTQYLTEHLPVNHYIE